MRYRTKYALLSAFVMAAVNLCSGQIAGPFGKQAINDQAMLVAAANTGLGPAVPSPSVAGLDWPAAASGNIKTHTIGTAATPTLDGIITINTAGVYRLTFGGRVNYAVTGTVPVYSITRLQRSQDGGLTFFGFDGGTPLSIPTESVWVASDYDTGGDGFLAMHHWIEHPYAVLSAGDKIRVAGYITDSAFATMVADVPYCIFRAEYLGPDRSLTSVSSSTVTTLSVIANTDDGVLIGSDDVYLDARNFTDDASLTVASSSAATVRVGQDATFDVRRIFLRFDTSAIPDGATVISAKLRMVASTDSSTTDFDVRIHKYTWTNPLAEGTKAADYAGALAGTLDRVWRNTSGMSTGTQYTSPPLDTTRVSKTGSTYYALVSSRDVSATAPSGNEFVVFHSANAASDANKPTLIVQYYTP